MAIALAARCRIVISRVHLRSTTSWNGRNIHPYLAIASGIPVLYPVIIFRGISVIDKPEV